jgi:hypothetical protein
MAGRFEFDDKIKQWLVSRLIPALKPALKQTGRDVLGNLGATVTGAYKGATYIPRKVIGEQNFDRLTGFKPLTAQNTQQKASEFIGSMAPDAITGSVLAKTPMMLKVTKPLYQLSKNLANTQRLGKLASPVSKVVGNVAQGLPYTALYNAKNRLAGEKTNVKGDLAFDAITAGLPILGYSGLTQAVKGGNYDELLKALNKTEYGNLDKVAKDKLLEQANKLLAGGLNDTGIIKGADGDVMGRFSANPPWYKEFFKANKRPPSNSEFFDIVQNSINKPKAIPDNFAGGLDDAYAIQNAGKSTQIKPKANLPKAKVPVKPNYDSLTLPPGRLQTPDGSPIGPEIRNPKVLKPDNFYNKVQVNRKYADNTKQPFVPQDGWTKLLHEDPKTWYSLRKVLEDRIQPKLPTKTSIGQTVQTPIQGISKSELSAQDAFQAPLKDIPAKSPVLDGQKDILQNNQIMSSQDSITDNELIVKLTNELKNAGNIRDTQEGLYKRARSEKLAKLMNVREKVAGEKGFIQELGALKGDLPKAKYESVRQAFDQKSVDRLFDMVRKSSALDEWEKINAQVGLAKILGEGGGTVPTKGELEKLHSVFGKEFTDTVLAKRGNLSKLGDKAMQVYNLPRSFMAGALDLSATMMQNAMFAYRHPILTAKNFKKQLAFFANEKAFKMSQAEIASRPNYQLMKDAKLSITDMGSFASKREEQFMGSWAESIPGVGKVIRASGRAYTGFLNRMRADVFDQMIDSYRVSGGEATPKYLRDLGDFINTSTGRGNLGNLERVAPVLGQGLFSARKLAATVQTINPMYYVNKDPQIRKEALLTMLSFMGGATLITQLSKLAGAEVSDDPTSSDFGKIKIGNTRFNMYGPYQQVAVLMSRLFKGYATSSTTGRKLMLGDESNPYSPNRLDLLTRFFESKEHPMLSLIVSALRGENNIGEKFDFPVELLNRFVPMVLADSYDLYKEHGPKGLLGAVPAILGIPAQTYGKQYPYMTETKTGKPKIEMRNEPGIVEDTINKVTGKPKSNIPQDQWQGITDTKKLKAEEAAGRDEVRESGKPQMAGNKYIYFDEETNQVKSVDMSFDIQRPKLSGNQMLDKKLVSTYKSKLSAKAKDVAELYELGVVTADQAEQLLRAIDVEYDSVGGPGSISVSKVGRASVPKIKIPARRTTKLKQTQINPPKLSNLRYQQQKPAKIDLEKLRNPL